MFFYSFKNILSRPVDQVAGEKVEGFKLVMQTLMYFLMLAVTTALAFLGEETIIKHSSTN